jgi:hypothetical protein
MAMTRRCRAAAPLPVIKNVSRKMRDTAGEMLALAFEEVAFLCL